MFKKIIFLFSLIILLIVLNNSKENVDLVYEQIEDNTSYLEIYLLFEDNSLNINNFDYYFKNLKVLKVYPYVNPIYKNKIESSYSYTFTHDTHAYDLERFANAYLNKIRSIGFSSEAINMQINGIIINKVLVRENLNNLKKYLKSNKVKYSLEFNGIYRKL